MTMTEEQWVKIAELLEGDVASIKTGLSMMNMFPMTDNRVQVVLLALFLDVRKNMSLTDKDRKGLFRSYCKNWYWYLYNTTSTLAEFNSPHNQDFNRKVDQHLALVTWLSNKKRTEHEKQWFSFYNNWITGKFGKKEIGG